MLTVFSIAICLGLLALMVYGLHRHQNIEVEFSVDRNKPLPPLNIDVARASLPMRREQASSPTPPSEAPANAEIAAAEIASRPAVAAIPSKKSDQETLAPDTEKPSKPGTSSPAKESWETKLARLKAAGEIDPALALCQSMFPLISAYEQACILLRSQVKSAAADPQLRQTCLTALYQTAAQAELLHDKSEPARRLSHKQLRSIPSDSYTQLDMPYQALGYAQLRLLRNVDIKLLRALWGEPREQLSPRQHHQAWWQQTATDLGI